VTTPLAEQTRADEPREDAFRRRLLDGLAASIDERGYRETTVADIVRQARTSKRTFYDHFSTKEECFVELLAANNTELIETIRKSVDPDARWRDQVEQAMTAYVHSIQEKPAITLSWIRELPALGEGARPMLRNGFNRLTAMLVELTSNPGFARDEIPPMSHASAVIIIGGLRELTAQTMEDGASITAIVEPALAVSLAILDRKDGRD
jgi:AcrR family transcriptional regulator